MTQPLMTATQRLQEPLWQWLNAVPAGRVITYGQLARLAGYPQQARLVGRMLADLPPDTRLPWHRVVNAQGRITHPDAARQVTRLSDEDIHVTQGRVSLRHYQWQP